MIVSPASLLGTISISAGVASETEISAPSATHAAGGSALTIGMRKVVLLVWDDGGDRGLVATDRAVTGLMRRSPTSSGRRMAAAFDVVEVKGWLQTESPGVDEGLPPGTALARVGAVSLPMPVQRLACAPSPPDR